MQISAGWHGKELEIVDLLSATFTASEGPDEGALIGNFTRELLQGTAESDIFVFTAQEQSVLIGAIVFSRLIYEEDARTVFILSPVAVATDWQKKGIGQNLLTYGLEAIREEGVDVAITYGDPNYYSKVGFSPITVDVAQAPFDLSHPHGWLAQSLTGAELTPLAGRPKCVAALNRPDLW